MTTTETISQSAQIKRLKELLPHCSPRKQKEIILRLEREQQKRKSSGYSLPGSSLPWREWVSRNFPAVCTHPFGERHSRLWNWFADLAPNVKPPARVEVWPRAGAKSSTGEMGTAYVGARLTRRFVLYVSETQPQADKHVQAIGTLFENMGVEKAVNRYGASKGWARDQLRTANGFNVAAMGLDAAGRGAKLDSYRPDVIILDDIDGRHDMADTIRKKIETITQSLLPAGSSDCAVLVLQNEIHKNSIVAQLVDGRADFLHNRDVYKQKAVVGLEYESREQPDGKRLYAITAGVPTWEGQNLTVCTGQINEWGLAAFLREAQHEVESADGIFFKVSQIRVCSPSEVPKLKKVCLAGDLAATEGGGDNTSFVVMGEAYNGTYYGLAVVRGQWASDRVRAVLTLICDYYLPQYPGAVLHLPQDPGQAGKDQKAQFQKQFARWKPRIEPVTGSKATRATGFQEQVNVGNFCLVQEDLPEILRPYCSSLSYLAWHDDYTQVLRDFVADEKDQVDDDVDASADAFNELAGKRSIGVFKY